MAKEALEGSTAHANCSINAVYNAPVIIVPDNMFSESAKYLKFNMGKIIINSDLREYNEKTKYAEWESDKDLYDIYQIDFIGFSLELVHFDDNVITKHTDYIVHDINMKI